MANRLDISKKKYRIPYTLKPNTEYNLSLDAFDPETISFKHLVQELLDLDKE